MAGAPCFSRVIFPSFGSQPPSYAPLSPLRPRRDGLPFSVPGFAPRQQARHVRRPYRIHSRCRPTVHLQLLSTPPHGDAVSFGYGPEGTGPGGLAPPGDAPLQAHCPGLQSGGRRRIAVVRSDSKPEHDAADGDDGDVVTQRLLVASGEAAGLLEQVEGTLDCGPGLV